MSGTDSLRVSRTILPANTVEALSPCDHSRKRPALVTTTFEKLSYPANRVSFDLPRKDRSDSASRVKHPLNCDLNIVIESSGKPPLRVLFI